MNRWKRSKLAEKDDWPVEFHDKWCDWVVSNPVAILRFLKFWQKRGTRRSPSAS